jgi:hypothetical protein
MRQVQPDEIEVTAAMVTAGARVCSEAIAYEWEYYSLERQAEILRRVFTEMKRAQGN